MQPNELLIKGQVACQLFRGPRASMSVVRCFVKVQSSNFVDFEVWPQEPRGLIRKRTVNLMTLRFEVCLWSIHLFLAKGGSCFHLSADAPKTAPTLSDEVVLFTGIDCSLLLQIHFFCLLCAA